MCRMVVCRCSFLDKWSCILWRMAVCLFPIPSLRMAYSNFYCMLHWLRFGFILLRCNRVSSIAPGFILLASLVVRVGSSICDVKGSANGRKSLTKFYYSENEPGSNLKAAGEKGCCCNRLSAFVSRSGLVCLENEKSYTCALSTRW